MHAGVPAIPRREEKEAVEFIEWLADNHFTFLGYREYRLERSRQQDRLVPVPRSGLGLMRSGSDRPRPQVTVLTGELQRKAREAVLLIVTKANAVSTVHRATYLDYVGIKVFDSRGRVVGERRFIGLFTSNTYSTSPRDIPLLRHKVQRVIDQIGVAPTSHDGKALLHVLETYPRDELFQSRVPELMRTARGIVNLYERQRVRLFARRDPYQRFYSCLLYVPRDHYNTQARERIERILLEELAGVDLESQVQISDSALARLHILVRTDPARSVAADIERIEQRITEAMRTWTDQLRDELHAALPAAEADALSRALPATRSRSPTRRTSRRRRRSATCRNSRRSRTPRPRSAWNCGRARRPAARCTCACTGATSRSRCPTCCRCSRTSTCASSTSGPTACRRTTAARSGSRTSRCGTPVVARSTRSRRAGASSRRSSPCTMARPKATASTGWCSRPASTGARR